MKNTCILCIFPSRVSGQGYRIGPVCVSVYVSVSDLPAEPFKNLQELLTLTTTWMSSKIKIKEGTSREGASTLRRFHNHIFPVLETTRILVTGTYFITREREGIRNQQAKTARMKP